jgi:hypothetical protein
MPIEIFIHKGPITETMSLDGTGHNGSIDGTLFNITKDTDGTYHVQAKLGDAMMRAAMSPGSAYAITSANGHIIDIHHTK